MEAPNETDRLRALVALMREGGLTRLALADGTVLERPATSPLEAAALIARQATSAAASAGDDDLDEMDAEEKRAEAEERDAEQEWTAYWRRMLASSGTAIPAFPGIEKANNFLARRGAH